MEWWARSLRAHSHAPAALPTLRIRDLATRCARVVPDISALKSQRARGMPGAQCTRSLVRAIGSKYAHEYSQRRHRITSGIPHAMVLTVSFALSPVTSSFLPPSPHE